MAYCDIADVKKVLKDDLFEYGTDVDDQIAWAEGIIDSTLGGHFELKFDAVANYATVPVQVEWAAAHLAAYKLWDRQVPLEGQTSDTAAQTWHDEAMQLMTDLISGDKVLTLADGTIVTGKDTGSMRFYPDGARTKADADDNVPFSTRARAHEW